MGQKWKLVLVENYHNKYACSKYPIIPIPFSIKIKKYIILLGNNKKIFKEYKQTIGVKKVQITLSSVKYYYKKIEKIRIKIKAIKALQSKFTLGCSEILLNVNFELIFKFLFSVT